jgi:glycosyltransferase involved in cell wall biosynthesis
MHRTDTLDGRMRAVSAYARRQAEMGHEVTMLSLVPAGDRAEAIEPHDQIRQLSLKVMPLSLGLGREATRYFRSNSLGGDVYHFHSSYARHWAASRILPVPYVVSPHGAYMASDMARKRLRNWAFRLTLGQGYLRHAALVHAVTPAEEASIIRYVGPLQVAVIPNCLDGPFSFDPAERAETRRRLGIGQSEPLLLYMGRLDVVGKGIDVLIEGFRRAQDRTKAPIRLVVAGPDDRGPRLPSLVDAAMKERILRMPAVFGAEKRGLLAAADAFVTLSRWDVMPTAVLDALGSGLPAIVTEETGFADFVRRPGMGQVVRHNSNEVADALLSVGVSDLDQRKQVFQTAMANFDPQLIAGRFLSLYERALAGAAGGLS